MKQRHLRMDRIAKKKMMHRKRREIVAKKHKEVDEDIEYGTHFKKGSPEYDRALRLAQEKDITFYKNNSRNHRKQNGQHTRKQKALEAAA